MANWTKTQGASLITLQSIASNTVVLSSAQDVSSKSAVGVHIHFGRRATTALTTGMTFRVEASSKSSGDGHWYTIWRYRTNTVAAETEAVSGTVNAGTNVITVASTTNLAVGDIIYIDNGTIGNSEWGRIKAVTTDTPVTIEDNLVNAQTSANIYDQAEIISAALDVAPYGRIRLVADGSGTGQAVAVEAHMTSADSFA